MLKKDTAICIRTVDYSETSQIVAFFTRDAGKLSAIAKGSKRPKNNFEGPIELFAWGQIVYSDSNKEKLATLTEFQQQLPFTFPSRDLYALHCASLAAELINLTIEEHDPHPELFDSLIQFLKKLEQSKEALSVLINFQLILLKEIGLAPIFDHCVNCKTRYEIRDTRCEFYFSSEGNGLVCRDCEASFPDKIPVIKAAANCLTNMERLKSASEKTLKQIEQLLIKHFTYSLGKQPKMAKFVVRSS